MPVACYRPWCHAPYQGIPIPRESKQSVEDDRQFMHSMLSAHGSLPSQFPYTPNVQIFPPAWLFEPRALTSVSYTPSWPTIIVAPGYSQASPVLNSSSVFTPALDGKIRIWPPQYLNIPQPLPEFFEPGTFPAVPWGTPVPLRLHPHLIYNPINPLIPMLRWDVSHQPEMARRYTGRHILTTPSLLETATAPGVSNLVIYSDHPVLAEWMRYWGPIKVEKENMSIRDLLDAIWEYMCIYLTEDDVRRVESGGQSANLENAARKRVKDGFELEVAAMDQGFKRVDVLGSHRRFLGVRLEVYNDRTFALFLGLAPLAL